MQVVADSVPMNDYQQEQHTALTQAIAYLDGLSAAQTRSLQADIAPILNLGSEYPVFYRSIAAVSAPGAAMIARPVPAAPKTVSLPSGPMWCD
jgi:hypothetical protein